MWRKTGDVESVVDLRAGLSLTIPVGTAFQFRCNGDVALKAVGVTMPPWPGMDEAYEVGFAMGLAERCGLDRQWSRGMPSRYDDSLGEAQVASAFQSGYAEARALDRPCVHGIAGRSPRRN